MSDVPRQEGRDSVPILPLEGVCLPVNIQLVDVRHGVVVDDLTAVGGVGREGGRTERRGTHVPVWDIGKRGVDPLPEGVERLPTVHHQLHL